MIILDVETKVMVCNNCESLLIPINVNVAIDVKYEPMHDFSTFEACIRMCPVCMSIIISEEYTDFFCNIVNKVNDLCMKYNTKNYKLGFLETEVLDSDQYNSKISHIIEMSTQELIYHDLRLAFKKIDNDEFDQTDIYNYVPTTESRKDNKNDYISLIKSMFSSEDDNMEEDI
jgi:hypothetical protein